MGKIKVVKATEEEINKLKMTSWPIWECEKSTFDWHYDKKETCLFLEGEVVVKTQDGDFSMGKDDIVVFPQGLSCTWVVKKTVKKHYKFG